MPPPQTQMLQRQILFKQLQEMQHQQQLQELSDARQHSFVNQLPFINKQTSAGLRPPLINGMHVHDASQMFMVGNRHLTQCGISPITQGVPNGLVFSQAQNQAIGSNGVLLQQFDVSLYGTPIASSGDNVNLYSRIQGASHDSACMLNKGKSSQLEIPVMQSSTVSNSFVNEQLNVSPLKVCISDGMFVPKNVTEDKNMFGQLLMHASADGGLTANFQQLHSLQTNTAMKESGMRQQEAGWPVFSAGKTSNLRPLQSATSLDPLEEKILFNTDDNSWGSSLDRHSNVHLAVFDSNVDIMGTFSSNQSGSWSALMQSAVAEASSSDTGQQEEWSGLTFQNPELSADNQHANYIGDGKQSSWVDNNLSILSSISKPEISFQNSYTNCSFPTFQQSHNLIRPKEGSDSSHDSGQQSSKYTSKWFERNLQHKQTVEGCQLVQTPRPLQNSLHDQRSENSKNDRHQPSVSPYTMSGQSSTSLWGHELKGNVWLHESGQPMVGGSQRPPDQAPHGWSNQEQGCVGQLNYADNVANIGMSSEKVLSADFQTNSRASEDLPPRNNVDSIATLFDSSADFSGQNINCNPSGNRLDLLNKADKSVEIRSVTHLGSRDSVPLSQVPQIENFNLYYNPSASQGFSVRLAPPSQQMPKSYSSLGSPSPGSSGVINASVPMYLNNQLKDQLVTAMASQLPHAELPAFTGVFQASIATSGDTSDLFQTSIQGQEFPTLESLPVTQPCSTTSLPQRIGLSMGPPNMTQDVPSPPDVLQSEVPNVFSNSLPTTDSTNSNADTARWSPHQQYKKITFQNGDNIKETNACFQTTQGYDCEEDQVDQLNSSGVSTPFIHNTLDYGHEAVGKHLSGANATTSVPLKTARRHQAFDREEQRDNNTPNVSGRDIEAFVSSLRPHGLQQNFALLHQVNADTRQQLFDGCKSVATNLALGDPNLNSQLNSISPCDNKPTNCASEASGNHPGTPSSKTFIQDRGMLVVGENGTRSHSKEQSRINVQMAPSWFQHYGSMKNGQMLSMYNLLHTKEAAKQFSIGQVNSSIASQPSSILPNSATKIVTAKQLSPPSFMPSDDSKRNLAVSTPKKRKLANFNLLPWHKEVTQVSQKFQKVGSVAKSEWALASNQLSEKVEHEAEMMEDVHPMSRAKKRLVLTTQLMQQVFRPAPAVIFSADACSNSENLVYFVARLALGDACSMMSGFQKPPLTSDMSSKNLRTSQRVVELNFSEAAEIFFDRAKRLANELLRLDRTWSIVDIKVDSQELERFSVINRFAKFHSRGNNVSVNTSSSSGATPAVHKTSPQRYVVAHPMPQVVPEGVNCISL